MLGDSEDRVDPQILADLARVATGELARHKIGKTILMFLDCLDRTGPHNHQAFKQPT